jgi:hypothetical protein
VKRFFGWCATLGAMLVYVVFPVILGLVFVAIGCSLAGPSRAGEGGSGGADQSTSSASSSASSSSGLSAPACTGDVDVPPGYGEGGGYYEHGVLACRRFTPSTYPFTISGFAAEYPTSDHCTLIPSMTWSIGLPNQLAGFTWSAPTPMHGGGSDTLLVQQKLETGQAFWGCLKLDSLADTMRSCVSGCSFDAVGQNGDFYWGDTAPPDGTMLGGYVLDPPVLEPLSASPTQDIAMKIGNDKLGLNIEVFGGP